MSGEPPLRYSGTISRFLFYSVIYLRNLPPDIGRAGLICQYIWSCRPPRRTRRTSLPRRRGLLPHVFTLALAGGRSLLRPNEIAPIWAFPSGAPSPVRTFLTASPASTSPSSQAPRRDGLSRLLYFSGRKVRKKFSPAETSFYRPRPVRALRAVSVCRGTGGSGG